MDRSDERKPVSNAGETGGRLEDDVQRERDEAREGDVLGLGGAAVPKAPGDPVPDNDPESRARRRERASGLDEPEAAEPNRDLPHGKGATGIDMGAGGSGTGIKR